VLPRATTPARTIVRLASGVTRTVSLSATLRARSATSAPRLSTPGKHPEFACHRLLANFVLPVSCSYPFPPPLSSPPLYPSLLLSFLATQYDGLLASFNTGGLPGAVAGINIERLIEITSFSPYPYLTAIISSFEGIYTGFLRVDITDWYTFYLTSDDGVRFWLNGQLLDDNYEGRGPTQDTSPQIYLLAGTSYSIKIEYVQYGGGEDLELRWSSSFGIPYSLIPTRNLYHLANLFNPTQFPSYAEGDFTFYWTFNASLWTNSCNTTGQVCTNGNWFNIFVSSINDLDNQVAFQVRFSNIGSSLRQYTTTRKAL